MSGFWTHLAFTWIASTGDFIYYVNGNVIFTQLRQKVKPFSGSGTLWLGRLTRADDLWLSGYVTQLNIFSRAFTANEVAIIARKLHCCNNLPHGDWLSWRNVTDAGKKFGDVRENSGAECTSFEGKKIKYFKFNEDVFLLFNNSPPPPKSSYSQGTYFVTLTKSETETWGPS